MVGLLVLAGNIVRNGVLIAFEGAGHHGKIGLHERPSHGRCLIRTAARLGHVAVQHQCKITGHDVQPPMFRDWIVPAKELSGSAEPTAGDGHLATKVNRV